MKSQEFDIIFCHDIYLLDFALLATKKGKSFLRGKRIPSEQFQIVYLNFGDNRRRILKKYSQS